MQKSPTIQNRPEYNIQQDRQFFPSEFDIYILASKQYDIGNAKSSVIILEDDSLLLLSCCCGDNSGLVVTMSRSDGKASELWLYLESWGFYIRQNLPNRFFLFGQMKTMKQYYSKNCTQRVANQVDLRWISSGKIALGNFDSQTDEHSQYNGNKMAAVLWPFSCVIQPQGKEKAERNKPNDIENCIQDIGASKFWMNSRWNQNLFLELEKRRNHKTVGWSYVVFNSCPESFSKGIECNQSILIVRRYVCTLGPPLEALKCLFLGQWTLINS